MEPQYYYDFSGGAKSSPNHTNRVTPMDRIPSNTSSASQQSNFSSDRSYSIPTSPGISMAHMPYEGNYLAPQHHDSSYGFFQQPENARPTPSSLGWTQGTDLVKLYRFIVPKGKMPYFQLLEKWTATNETPSRVYLDDSKGYKKNQFPCKYPGPCNGKQNVFGRPADLERHYKNVHADEKDQFPCDYGNGKCSRSQDPFSRKDHYRDHLRDFHKEDIGCARGEKSFRDKQDKREWHKAQKAWLAERVISPKHWRCAKCLVKNYVAEAGWECWSCKTSCEEDRVRARQRLSSGRQTPEDSTEATMTDGYVAAAPYSSCGTCNGGWVEDVYVAGAYVACPLCVSANTPVSYPYESSEYDPARQSAY